MGGVAKRIHGVLQGRSATARGGVAGFFSRKRLVTALDQCVKYLSSTPKNPPSGTSSALSFLNLHLHAREARGTYANQWLSLSCAKESLGKIDPSLILEYLFNEARTYFSKNC